MCGHDSLTATTRQARAARATLPEQHTRAAFRRPHRVFPEDDNPKRFETDGDGFVDGISLSMPEAAPRRTRSAKRKEMICHKWVLPQTSLTRA